MIRDTSSIRIVIATGDLEFRLSLIRRLQCESGFTVIAEASDEAGLLRLRRQLDPDILLLDSALSSIVHDAVNSWPDVRIILLATIIDEEQVIQALRLPARGIVPKTAPPQVLFRSIRSVLEGQYWLGAESIAVLVRILRDVPAEYNVESSGAQHGLTAREEHIIGLIATGCSNKEISQKLFISERTVKHHLTSIFEKLGLSSRLQLAAFAVTHRLVQNGSRAAATIGSGSAERGPRKPLPAVSLISS